MAHNVRAQQSCVQIIILYYEKRTTKMKIKWVKMCIHDGNMTKNKEKKFKRKGKKSEKNKE